LARGGDARDGVSDVISNQKRSGLVDGEPDRPSGRLPVRISCTAIAERNNPPKPDHADRLATRGRVGHPLSFHAFA
jgi:hypothetical protein